jgi:beta-glucanase (GH16 family)
MSMKCTTNVSRRYFLKAAAFGIASVGLPGPGRFAFARGASIPAPLAKAGGRWAPSFVDDFSDAASIDQNWVRMTDRGDGHKTVRLPQNVTVSGGELDLKLGHGDDKDRPFTGGFVQSRSFRQRYGYFECEMRIADEPGVNNAFWLTSDRSTEGNVRFELDVAEAKYPDVVQVAARQWLPRRITHSTTYRSGLRLAGGFHRYGMLWTEAEFRFFFDDKPIYAVANTFAHTPAMILFSNAVAPFAGKTDGHVDGAETSIGQVRVFENVG